MEPRVKTGFTSVPGGPGGSGGTLGGSGLGVSRHSAHPQEAVKLVHFLFHAQIESIERRRGSDRSSERFIQNAAVVHRPSIETGNRYTEVSVAYVRALHAVLTGQKLAPQAAAELEKQLILITGLRPGPPKIGK
jgi:trehalose/maltose transport system substrate-binding protein